MVEGNRVATDEVWSGIHRAQVRSFRRLLHMRTSPRARIVLTREGILRQHHVSRFCGGMCFRLEPGEETCPRRRDADLNSVKLCQKE